MDKLELKHLAPYLPYGLTIRSSDGATEILGYQIINGELIYQLDTDDDSGDFAFDDSIKPVLRPLSEYGGKITAGEIKGKLNCDLGNVHEIWALGSNDITLDEISYKTYKVMCKNHIDFNNLIEKGLAIDINTLNKT